MKEGQNISANMTVLDVVSEYPGTEAVFRSYDEQVGKCICCQMLFEPVQRVAGKYNLNLSELLAKLNQAVTN
jgi:iron-sulfur cluster repair protein YtfE (RIC family)